MFVFMDTYPAIIPEDSKELAHEHVQEEKRWQSHNQLRGQNLPPVHEGAGS